MRATSACFKPVPCLLEDAVAGLLAGQRPGCEERPGRPKSLRWLWPAAPGWPLSGRRGLLWRPWAAGSADRAHQADVIPVGTGHDRTARTPEGGWRPA